jgi:hypothetical protein
MGGLSYLNKKDWHPEKNSNVEKVWAAESKRNEEEK